MKGVSLVMTSRKKNNTLLVITGPTAVGKTALSISLAKALGTHILSADARQFYRELQVGTATPDSAQRAQVPHHFVGHLSIHDYYNVSLYEKQALDLLGKLFKQHEYIILTGGSGLYIDTLCFGIDDLPPVSPAIRKKVQSLHAQEGLTGLREQLKALDPIYYGEVDRDNPKRLMRALEVCWSTGKPYSGLRQKRKVDRPFHIKRLVLDRPRHELFERISKRVNQMLHMGLVEEALSLFPCRHLNALNTVGYKELFAWLAGEWTLHQALEKINTNTRRYAKRQLTWFKRYDDAVFFHPDQEDEVFAWLEKKHE